MEVKWLLLVCPLLVVFLSSVSGDGLARIDSSVSTPSHYAVDLTLDVAAKSFSADVKITISIHQATETLEIASAGSSVSWFDTQVLSESGEKYSVAKLSNNDFRQIVLLTFDQKIPVGSYSLIFSGVTGAFGNGFVEVNVDDGDSKGYLLTTGPLNTNLRNIFPCFDEPEFRATYEFTVYHPAGYSVVTNTDQVTMELGPFQGKGDMVKSSFSFYRPLSPTSISLMLTDMESQTSTDNRVKVYHTHKDVRGVLLKNYLHALLSAENELRVNKEVPLLQVVYNPSLVNMTLTKWGVISVGPEMMPVENSVVHSVELKDLQKEISLSVFKLYYGHLISPQWWTDQWVFLGVARYYSAIMPFWDFDGEAEFVVDTVQPVIDLHRTIDYNSMVSPPYNLYDVNYPNVVAVDLKAAAMIRMFSNVLDVETFRVATRDYVVGNAYLALTYTSFIQTIERFTVPSVFLPPSTSMSDMVLTHVQDYMYKPSLYVQRLSGGAIKVSRFMSTSTDLPMDYMTPSNATKGAPKQWMRRQVSETDFDPADWMVVNPDQYGVYSVGYSTDLWTNLTSQLNGTDFQRFNRRQLISNAITEVSGIFGHVRHYLNLMSYVHQEEDSLTWKVARISFEKFSMDMWGYKGDMEPFVGYFRNLTRDKYLANRIQKEMKNFEMTIDVAKIACATGLPECLKDVEDYYVAAQESKEGLIGSRDFQAFIYCTLSRSLNDTEELVKDVLSLWTEDRRVNSKSRNAIRGLSCANDRKIIRRFVELSISESVDEEGMTLDTSERIFLLKTFLKGSETSIEEALRFIKEYFPVINRLIPHPEEVFHELRYYTRTSGIYDLAESIVLWHTHIMRPELRTFIWLELINGNYVSLDRNKKVYRQFPEWVNEQNDVKASAGSLKVTSLVIASLAWIVIRYFN